MYTPRLDPHHIPSSWFVPLHQFGMFQGLPVALWNSPYLAKDGADLDESLLDRFCISVWHLWHLGKMYPKQRFLLSRLHFNIYLNSIDIHDLGRRLDKERPTNLAAQQWVIMSLFESFWGAIFYGIMMAKFFRSFDSERVLIKLMHAIWNILKLLFCLGFWVWAWRDGHEAREAWVSDAYRPALLT